MLNVLEGFDLASLNALGAERIHLEAEAKKLAFRDLYEKVGDPEFEEISTRELISKDYAARLRENISPTRAAGSAPEPALGNDTVYLCAVDAEGNGCSFINSLYKWFGSGIVAPGTGVCLQNRGHSFRLDEGHPNALAPGKRPLHTIIPGLATRDGALWAVFGVMGGSMQPQGHTQLLANLIDFDMSPQEAVDHPRHRHEGDRLLVEGRVPETEVEKLRALGHRVEVGEDYAIPTGGAQLICVLENGVRACGSDPLAPYPYHRRACLSGLAGNVAGGVCVSLDVLSTSPITMLRFRVLLGNDDAGKLEFVTQGVVRRLSFAAGSRTSSPLKVVWQISVIRDARLPTRGGGPSGRDRVGGETCTPALNRPATGGVKR